MQPTFDFYSLFGLVALGQGIFLLLFIAMKHHRSSSYRLLFLVLFVLLFEVLHDFLVRTRLILEVPDLLSTGHLFSYCIGPLIFLYVLSLTRTSFKFKALYLLHFLPFLFYNLSKIPSYLQTKAQKLSFLTYYYSSLEKDPKHFFKVRDPMDILEGLLRYDVHKIFYVAVAFYFFIAYKRDILNQYANLEKTNIRWMKTVLYGYLIIWLIIPVQRFSGFIINDLSVLNNIGYMLLPIHVYFISFVVFSQQNATELLSKNKPAAIPDEGFLKEIIDKSNGLLRTEKVYLNPDLTLPMLAGLIEVRDHNLSLAINHLSGVNFFDYINQYRVQEAQQLLKQPEQKQYTVEYIGTQSGFSSKATFYRAFKKLTGSTPSQFQKEHSTG
ncbi:MAG: helix-turn-helix transcriptional regulator [Cyclobacteriaceae bacterium]